MGRYIASNEESLSIPATLLPSATSVLVYITLPISKQLRYGAGFYGTEREQQLPLYTRMMEWGFDSYGVNIRTSSICKILAQWFI